MGHGQDSGLEQGSMMRSCQLLRDVCMRVHGLMGQVDGYMCVPGAWKEDEAWAWKVDLMSALR